MGQWRHSTLLASAAATDMDQSSTFRSIPGDLGHGGYFLDIILKAQFMKEIIDKLYFIKIKDLLGSIGRNWARQQRGACQRLRAVAQMTEPTTLLLLTVLRVRPSAPNQQQPTEGTDGIEPKETAPLEGDQQQGGERIPPPRFWPRYWGPFHPRPPQQPNAEGGDDETKPSQGPTDSSWPEPQRTWNCPYFQWRRQQFLGPRQPTTPETSAPINSGDPPATILEWFQLKGHPESPSGICQFFQLTCILPSTSLCSFP